METKVLVAVSVLSQCDGKTFCWLLLSALHSLFDFRGEFIVTGIDF